MRGGQKEKPKSKTTVGFVGDELYIRQEEPYGNGMGGFKWDKQTIILTPVEIRKVLEAIHNHSVENN